MRTQDRRRVRQLLRGIVLWCAAISVVLNALKHNWSAVLWASASAMLAAQLMLVDSDGR